METTIHMTSPFLVHDYLTLSATRFPDKVALICGEQRETYETIDRRSDQLAETLGDMGLKFQDRVAIFLDNSIESVVAIYGTLKAGGVIMMLNGSMKAKKLAYIMRDAGARVLITHVNKLSVIQDAADDFLTDCRIIWIGNPTAVPKTAHVRCEVWAALFHNVNSNKGERRHRSPPIDRQRCCDRDLAALIYTSGSTGEPKGVMSAHCNVICAAQSIISFLQNTSDDVILNVLPLSFDYGLYQVIMAFMFGGTVIIEKPFLYPVNVLERIPREGVTGFPIVPTIAAMFLKMRNLSAFDFSSLRYATSTSAPLPVEHIRKLRALMPNARLYSMYGLTECKRVSYLPPEELDRRPSSVGKAIPNCSVTIVTEDGREASVGEVGELVVRGANVMQGYWNAPELTAKFFREGPQPGDRALYSGDLFRKDDEGFLYFVGRKDDLIKSRGERVSPKEVENVLCSIEGVAQSAVIGVTDEILGQSIKAFVVCEPGAQLTRRELLKFCLNHLESYMIPKHVEFLAELPKTPHGKIDKEALRRLECRQGGQS
jgi:long-chain acyl-CoA synthetase